MRVPERPAYPPLPLRPERDDIGAPVLPGRIRWLNADEPPVLAALTATGPVLVHFMDVAQLNCVRSLPYVIEWQRRYAPLGLSVLAIHSPRFAFTGDEEIVRAGIEKLGVEHPVAVDSDYAIWHDYGVKGWPSLFLWGQGGALRWAHFGEGEYLATEEAIQAELRAEDVTVQLPEPMRALRTSDEPGRMVLTPSPELFPGGSPATPWTPEAGAGVIEHGYEAAGAWVVADGDGELIAAVDGGAPEPVDLSPPGLAPLAAHGAHGAHHLRLEASDGVRVWALSFEPGAA